VQSDGTLTPVGEPRVEGNSPLFLYVAWDTNHHLYAFGADCRQWCQTTNVDDLYIYNFDGENVTPAPGSPHEAGLTTGLAVVPAS
jgi:hypothetical protein